MNTTIDMGTVNDIKLSATQEKMLRGIRATLEELKTLNKNAACTISLSALKGARSRGDLPLEDARLIVNLLDQYKGLVAEKPLGQARTFISYGLLAGKGLRGELIECLEKNTTLTHPTRLMYKSGLVSKKNFDILKEAGILYNSASWNRPLPSDIRQSMPLIALAIKPNSEISEQTMSELQTLLFSDQMGELTPDEKKRVEKNIKNRIKKIENASDDLSDESSETESSETESSETESSETEPSETESSETESSETESSETEPSIELKASIGEWEAFSDRMDNMDAVMLTRDIDVIFQEWLILKAHYDSLRVD